MKELCNFWMCLNFKMLEMKHNILEVNIEENKKSYRKKIVPWQQMKSNANALKLMNENHCSLRRYKKKQVELENDFGWSVIFSHKSREETHSFWSPTKTIIWLQLKVLWCLKSKVLLPPLLATEETEKKEKTFVASALSRFIIVF